MGLSAPACLLWHLLCQLAGLCGQPATLPRRTAQNQKLLCSSLLPTGSGAGLKAICCSRRDIAAAVLLGPESPVGTSAIFAWLLRRKWRPAGRLQQGQDALTRALAGHLSQLCCCRSLELPCGWDYPQSLASPVCPASLLLSLLVPAACALGVCVLHSCAGAGQACHRGLVCFPAQPQTVLGSLAIQTEVPMVSTYLCGSLPPTSPWGCVLAASGGVGLFRAAWCSTSFARIQLPMLQERHGVRAQM